MSLCFKLTLEIVKLFHTHTCQKRFWQAPLKPFSFICIPTIPKSNAENPPTPRWVLRIFYIFFNFLFHTFIARVYLSRIYYLQKIKRKEIIPMVLPLTHMNPGESARIVWIASDPSFKQHLDNLGFCPQEIITCIQSCHRRRMSAYRVRGLTIALRRERANEIFAEILFLKF